MERWRDVGGDGGYKWDKAGCTGSPQLFVMVVNAIIDRVVGSRRGYRDDDFYVPVCFMQMMGCCWLDRVGRRRT